MHETHRMLGGAHEADLEREAEKRRLANEARRQHDTAGTRRLPRSRLRLFSFVLHGRTFRSPEPKVD